MSDSVNHPSHYNDGKIEVIEFIEDKSLGFHLGNAVKYIARAGKKDKAKHCEDLEKARWYLDREIEIRFASIVRRPNQMNEIKRVPTADLPLAAIAREEKLTQGQVEAVVVWLSSAGYILVREP